LAAAATNAHVHLSKTFLFLVNLFQGALGKHNPFEADDENWKNTNPGTLNELLTTVGLHQYLKVLDSKG
jgi:hypothetical protein